MTAETAAATEATADVSSSGSSLLTESIDTTKQTDSNNGSHPTAILNRRIERLKSTFARNSPDLKGCKGEKIVYPRITAGNSYRKHKKTRKSQAHVCQSFRPTRCVSAVGSLGFCTDGIAGQVSTCSLKINEPNYGEFRGIRGMKMESERKRKAEKERQTSLEINFREEFIKLLAILSPLFLPRVSETRGGGGGERR